MCRNSHKWDFCPYIIGEIVIEAGQKMGEMLLAIQRQTGNQYKNASSDGIEKAKTKTEITAEMGMTKDQVSQYQQMAQNPEAVPNGITLPKWKSFKRVDYAKKHNFKMILQAVEGVQLCIDNICPLEGHGIWWIDFHY